MAEKISKNKPKGQSLLDPTERKNPGNGRFVRVKKSMARS